jgi:hypothetical protein
MNTGKHRFHNFVHRRFARQLGFQVKAIFPIIQAAEHRDDDGNMDIADTFRLLGFCSPAMVRR